MEPRSPWYILLLCALDTVTMDFISILFCLALYNLSTW